MTILFSPSETKIVGGTHEVSPYLFDNKLKDKQTFVINKYLSYINSSSKNELSKLFGLKKQKDIDLYKSIDINNDEKLKAVERYVGVAYDYFNYKTLNKDEKGFIDNNMIIFSNLLGPIHAGYKIPNYKLKQGEKLGSFVVDKYYKEHFKNALDELLDDEFIIDLRAGFYQKFYIPKHCVTMKFIKNGKVVSHWAKAYRGKVSRELAKYQPRNEQDFQNISFENLQILEIIKGTNKHEYVFEISS